MVRWSRRSPIRRCERALLNSGSTLRPASFYSENGIELRLNAMVTAIDARAREVALASGDKIGADLTLAGQTSPVGLVYTDAGSPVSSILTLPALTAGQNAVTTGELTYSGLQTDLGATFGASVAG